MWGSGEKKIFVLFCIASRHWVCVVNAFRLIFLFKGRRSFTHSKWVFLVTDGRSNVDAHLTIPNADALKASGVRIFVVAIGNAISGIDELVKVASDPFRDLLRLKDFSGFWNLIQLTVKLVSPSKYQFVNYNPPCN